MQFQGPTQILLQTRASRMRDVLTARDVNEIADVEPGILQPAVTLDIDKQKWKSPSNDQAQSQPVTEMSYASVGEDGKVKFQRSS